MGGSVLLGPGEHEADTSDVEKGQAGDFEEELEAERIAVEGDGAGNVLNSDGDLPKGGGFESREGEYIATSDLDASDGAGGEVESGGPPRQNEGTDGRAMFGRGRLDTFIELYEFTEALAEDSAGEDASDPGQSDGFEHFVRPELSPDRRPEHGQTLGFPPEDVEGYGVSLFRYGADHPRQFGDICPGPVRRVEGMEELVRVCGTRCFEKCWCEGGSRPPAFVFAEDGAKSLAGYPEATAFVAEDKAPASGSGGLALGVFSK